MPAVETSLSAPSVPHPALAWILGEGWLAPAWRGIALFLLGLLCSGWLEQLMMLASYGWLVLAIYRYLQVRELAPEGPEVPELGDALAAPEPLDALVQLNLQADEKPREWSAQLLHALEWKRMGDLCLAFYKERGLQASSVSFGSDGSVDAVLQQSGQSAAFALMHCRARGEAEVGAEAVEALLPKMHEAGVERAFFMGVKRFSREAHDLARAHQITLVDERMFLALLARLSHDDRQRLLNLAVEGDYATPSCPGCLLKMLPRESARGRYWGCRAYPLCKHTLGMHP